MKFRAHDTFFIRKGWLSKGMRYVVQRPDIFIAKDENPMDILGIGSNMVKAMRYWLQAVGLTSESTTGKRTQRLTPLGESIYKYDRYIEEFGTLYLLQYRLACNKDNATAWYYFLMNSICPSLAEMILLVLFRVISRCLILLRSLPSVP